MWLVVISNEGKEEGGKRVFSPPSSFFMRYIILIFILLALGCSSIQYYPDRGNIKFYNSSIPYKCNLCKEDVYLYKVDSKHRIICDRCFRKLEKLKKIDR